ncbi:hypothetical protein Tco_0983475 [Tanacetum coccineum]
MGLRDEDGSSRATAPIPSLRSQNSTCLGLRKKSRLSLKNDMPLRDKLLFYLLLICLHGLKCLELVLVTTKPVPVSQAENPPFPLDLEALNSATGGIFLYKTPNQAYQLLEDKVLLKLDWAKNQKTKSSLKKTVAFADEGSSNFATDKTMARMDAMTMKMDAKYKEMQSRSNHSIPEYDEDDKPMSPKAEAKFMQTF